MQAGNCHRRQLIIYYNFNNKVLNKKINNIDSVTYRPRSKEYHFIEKFTDQSAFLTILHEAR